MQRNSNLFNRGKTVIDVLILAVLIVSRNSLLSADQPVFSAPNLTIFFACLGCWLIAARLTGLYRDFTSTPFSIELVVFLKALIFYTLTISFVFFQFSAYFHFRTLQVLLHCGFVFFLLPVQKLALRVLYKRLRNSNKNQRSVLIVGATKTGMHFYEQFVKNHRYGYKLAGFIDDEKHPSLNGSYLGKFADLDNVLAKHELDDIVVALSSTDELLIEKIVMVGEREGKRVRIIPNYQRFGNGKLQVDKFGNLSVITLRSLPLDSLDNRLAKRAFDIFFSLLVFFCVFSWLFPLVALLIKCSSKGPVLFKQERWGLNNKSIVCWKFRTMCTSSKDINEQGKYQQACKGDPRITLVGRFLRKTSLDELPQFINVLRGSMSVIGPRPHPVPLNLESKDSVEKYMMRHWVKPGISGWAQVHGYRGETKELSQMKKRVQYDIWYIENWTFGLDLQIVVQTLVNIVKGEKNAY